MIRLRITCAISTLSIVLLLTDGLVEAFQSRTNVPGVRIGVTSVTNIFIDRRDARATHALRAVAPPFGLFDRFRKKAASKPVEKAAVCIVGGGVAGLTAAAEAAKSIKPSKEEQKRQVILFEASTTLGGRVQSDKTDDGYVLDRGFAVFIEEYPMAKKLLDYQKLGLGKFQPGALVKVEDQSDLARVADPFRQPEAIFEGVMAPVGSILDKLNLLPAIFHCTSSSIESLFEEEETDTLTALMVRWNLGQDIVDRFFKPFLEGIYLAPLEQQSSRMFHFVFKMFSEGAATLPCGGIGAISEQLAEKAEKAGVDLRTAAPVCSIIPNDDGFLIETESGDKVQASSVVLAVEGPAAQKLISHIDGFESLESLPVQPQRSVGCLYYSFDGPAPVDEPILILNGIGAKRGDLDNPVNNVCFPSVVNPSYAPVGKNLISVTVLKGAMEAYEGDDSKLDQAVRKQLSGWFPKYEKDILEKWELKRIYKIANAQPGQWKGPLPANVHGGRDCTKYRGKELPKGLFVCGDHMATATLNGALESGISAGAGASVAAKSRRKESAATA